MGAMTPAGALLASGVIGGGSSLLSGLLSSNSASANNRAAMNFQKWSQLQAQQYQTQMYNQQKMDQENFYKKYQSPEAIAEQLSQLGVNPSVVLSGGHGVGASPAVMPSGISSPALSAPSLENEGTAFAQSIQALGSAMSSLAQSGATNEQSQEALATFNERLNALFLQNNQTKLMNAKAQWDLFASQVKLPYEVQEMVYHAYSEYYSGNYSEALAKLTNVQAYIEEHTKEFTIENRQKANDLLGKQILIAEEDYNLRKEQQETERTQQKLNKSGESANYAQAALANAQTASEKTRKSILDFDAIIRGNDAKISSVTLSTKINTIKSQLKNDKQLAEATRAAAYIELQKLNRIILMYKNHPEKLRLDATLKNFNENFPVLSQIGGLAKGLK